MTREELDRRADEHDAEDEREMYRQRGLPLPADLKASWRVRTMFAVVALLAAISARRADRKRYRRQGEVDAEYERIQAAQRRERGEDPY